jgi:hypothetical protein
VRRARRGRPRSLRQLAQLAPDRGDVAFLAGDRRLHLADAIEVLLVVALVALPLGLAVVVVLLQRREALLLGAQLVLEDAAGIAVARPLRGRIDACGGRAGCGRRRTRRRRGRLGRTVWITVIGAPSIVLQPRSFASFALIVLL